MDSAGESRGALSAAAARFAADLAAIWPDPCPIGLAVSGGPDSLALLVLAHACRPEGIEAATVDHRLRPGSAAEAAMVARVCAARGIVHRILPVEVGHSGNLQANARGARYAALAEWADERGLGALATAHHLDDQAETLLMRLVRGSGARGLAGMRPAAPLPGAPGRVLLRPLLGWRRAELAEVVAASGLEPAHDPGNDDPRFARVAIRRHLAQSPWLPAERLATSAAHLADAEAVVAWAAQEEFAARVQVQDDGWDYRPAGPRAVRLRVVERLIASPSAKPPRGADLDRLLIALESGRPATLGGVKATPRGAVWMFRPAPPRRARPASRSQ